MNTLMQKQFIQDHWHLNLQQLKQKRLFYRDSKSLEARILNILIKAKMNESFVSQVLAHPDSQSLAFQVISGLQDEIELSKKIKDFNQQPYLQILRDANSINDRVLASLTQKRKEFQQKIDDKAELNPSLAEVVEQQGELIHSLGDLAAGSDKIRFVTDITKSSAESLSLGGLVGTILANTLGLIINSYACLKERRMPNDFEKAKISYSFVVLTLIILVFSGIGGPLGMSILSTIGVFLAFSKTVAEIVRDQFRLHSARTLAKKYEDTRSTLLTEIKTLIDECFAIKGLKHGQQNQEQCQSFHAKLALLDQKTLELATTQKYWSYQVLKTQLLEERQENKFIKARKFGFLLGSSISLVGAVFSLTPLLPVGIALLATGALVSLFTEISYRFSEFFHQRQQQKFAAHAQQNRIEVTDLKEDSDVSVAHQLGVENILTSDLTEKSPQSPSSITKIEVAEKDEPEEQNQKGEDERPKFK